jgi:hypothetical protein
MGIGIWSIHFIGMLAFRLPIPRPMTLGDHRVALHRDRRRRLRALRGEPKYPERAATRTRRVSNGAGNCSHAFHRSPTESEAGAHVDEDER